MNSVAQVSIGAPSRPDQIFCLDLTGAHLPILGTLLDFLHQLLLLVLELHALTVKFPLGLLEGSLVFPQSLLGCHALPECPFDDLRDNG